MYAITGITGKVGGTLARSLLKQGQRVRAVVRDASNGEAWAALGCEASIAHMEDAAALTAAFNDVTAVFILPPPIFDPSPGFPEMHRVAAAVAGAISSARPDRVLCLSTIGAQATQESLLSQLSIMERALSGLAVPVSFLRPAWYLDNASWDVAPARHTGVISSFLTPLDRPFPMVSSEDVGMTAARLIQQNSIARIIELEGPRRVAPNDLARAFAQLLEKPVRAGVVSTDQWDALFRAQGMKNPTPRIRMLQGFNEGWIDFSGGQSNTLKGIVTAEDVVRKLLASH